MTQTKMQNWGAELAGREPWESLDFPIEEFQERQRRVRAAMAKEGVDLILIIEPRHLHWLMGYKAKSYQEFQCLLFPLEENEELTFLVRDSEECELNRMSLADNVEIWGGRYPGKPTDFLRKLMEKKGYMNRSIGLELPDFFFSITDYRELMKWLPPHKEVSKLVENLKLAKSPREIAYVRKAAKIADIAMEACVGAIHEGATEYEICAEMYRALVGSGGDLSASPINFVSGPRTPYAHGLPTERKIERGDFMHVEFGAAFHKYTCTMARNLVLGQPSEKQQRFHDVQRAACDAVIASAKPGISSEIPHLEAVRVIEEAGLGDARTHTTGYGVAPGFAPSWFESSVAFDSGYPFTPRVLEAGMVMTIEPPVLSCKDSLGARNIDNILITETGCEVLQNYSRDLIVID